MESEGKWVAAHAVAQCETVARTAGKTLRCELPVGIGGGSVRLVLAEHYGASPVLYGGVALGKGDEVFPVEFEGEKTVLVLPGEERVSDPVKLKVSAGETLTLWLYNAGERGSRGTSILPAEVSAVGDFCGGEFAGHARKLKLQRMRGYARLEVEAEDPSACAIAAFGDSITAMGFWTEPMQQRLSAYQGVSFLNMGISGNRLLADTVLPLPGRIQLFGHAALKRLERDVLRVPGVRAAVVELGVNDIAAPGVKHCTAEELINGFERLVSRMAARNIKTAGCTLTPFGGNITYCAENAHIRNEVNAWILTSGVFDTVIDFAGAVCDAERPDFMKKEYDSGDHLHPSAAGGKKMAESVDIEALLHLLNA